MVSSTVVADDDNRQPACSCRSRTTKPLITGIFASNTAQSAYPVTLLHSRYQVHQQALELPATGWCQDEYCKSPGYVRPLMKQYISGTPEEFPDRYRLLSPLTHVSAKAPPTITILGASDRLVAKEQSKLEIHIHQQFAAPLTLRIKLVVLQWILELT